MAMKDEVREQQKKLQGKSFREKLEYFWDYYKIHTIAALFTLFVVIFFIRDAANSKDEAFSAIVLNSYGYEKQEEFQEDFASYAGIDTEAYSCLIDASSTLSLDSMTQLDLAFTQRLAALVQTNAVDSFISDAAIFGHYAEGMMFLDLREVLSEEEYQKYEPCFYYVDAAVIEKNSGTQEIPYQDEDYQDKDYLDNSYLDNSYLEEKAEADPTDPSAMEEPVPVGIFLEDSVRLAQWGCYTSTEETPVFGFVLTSKRPELSRLFLAYLTE